MTSWVVSRDIPASALGDIGDGSAVAPLIAAMSSGDEKVRASAAEALGKIADPRSIEPLVGSLYDTCGDVREKAGIALAQIREAALAPLIGVVMDQRPDNAMINRSTARAAAVKALGEIRDARAVGPLMNALRDKDGPVREEATNALAKIGGPAVKPLMTDLADAKLDVRMQAVSTLAKIGQPAVEPLIDVLKGDDQIAAAYAAKALGEIKDPRAMAFLSAVQNHSNPVVRKAVAEALNNMR
jgi:HEAT repeat protein